MGLTGNRRKSDANLTRDGGHHKNKGGVTSPALFVGVLLVVLWLTTDIEDWYRGQCLLPGMLVPVAGLSCLHSSPSQDSPRGLSQHSISLAAAVLAATSAICSVS